MRHLSLMTLLALLAPAGAAQNLILSRAQVVDPAAETVTRGDLLIEDGRVVGPVESPPEGFEGAVVDVGDRYVIPGLVDTHTHSFGNQAPNGQTEVLFTPGTAKRMLYAGVTGFLDLFNMEDVILGMRDSQRTSDHYPGARIYASGPCLTATEGHCSEYGIPTRIIDTPEDAVREITALAVKKPDVVKIVYDHESYGGHTMPSIDLPTLEAAIRTAETNDLPTVIHIGHWQDLREAVLAGATAVTHTPDGPMPKDLPRIMRDKGTMIIPTLAVQTELADLLADPSPLDDGLLRAVTSEKMLASYRSVEGLSERYQGWVARQKRARADVLRSVGALAKAGVPVLAGTDAGNAGLFQGWSLHRELEKLVEAGLTPWHALRAATTAAGPLLGETFGVTAGARADLVVLEASPIEDIRNTRKIVQVILGGEVVDRAALLASQ